MCQAGIQAGTNLNPLFHVDDERTVTVPKLGEQGACTPFDGRLHRVHAAARVEHQRHIKRHFLASEQ